MECFLSPLHVRAAVHLQLCVSSSWLQCKCINAFCTAHITHCAAVQLCAQSGAQCARTCSVGITARCCHQKDPRKETGERCCCEKRCENPDFPPCFSKFLSRLERRRGGNVCKVLWEWMAARKRRQVWPAVFFTKLLWWRIFQPTTELWFKIDILSCSEGLI